MHSAVSIFKNLEIGLAEIRSISVGDESHHPYNFFTLFLHFLHKRRKKFYFATSRLVKID